MQSQQNLVPIILLEEIFIYFINALIFSLSQGNFSAESAKFSTHYFILYI